MILPKIIQKTHSDGDITLTDCIQSFNPNDTDATVFAGDDYTADSDNKLYRIGQDQSILAEYKLDSHIITIGRLMQNDIQINDASVSGCHASIRLQGDQYVLSDLNSKNGTFVNNKKISEEKKLVEDDFIQIGKTVFRFISGNSFLMKPVTKKNKLFRIPGNQKLTCLIILVTMLGSFFAIRNFNIFSQHEATDKNQTLVSAKKDLSEKDHILETVLKQTLLMGNQFLETGQWEDAIRQYETILAVRPEYPGVADRFEKAQYELRNIGMIHQGLELIRNKNIKKGLELLKEITENSVYYAEVQEKIKTVEESGKKKRKRAESLKASAAPQKKNNEDIEMIEKSAPLNDEQVAEIRRKGKELLNLALTAYRNGNIEDSIIIISDIYKLNLEKNDTLKNQIEQTEKKIKWIYTLFQNGSALYSKKLLSQAYRNWDQVLHLDFELVGDASSYYASHVSVYMEQIYYQKALDALDAKKYNEANEYCIKILTANPKHNGGKMIREKLDNIAVGLIDEGSVMAKVNREISLVKWKDAIAICEPHGALYEKCRSLISNSGQL